jgi:hypothetical protein
VSEIRRYIGELSVESPTIFISDFAYLLDLEKKSLLTDQIEFWGEGEHEVLKKLNESGIEIKRVGGKFSIPIIYKDVLLKVRKECSFIMIDEVSSQSLSVKLDEVIEGEVENGVAVETEIDGDFKVYGVYDVEDDFEELKKIEIVLYED